MCAHTNTCTCLHTHMLAAFSEYTEYEDDLGEPTPNDSSTLVHYGLYDDEETRARRRAWRRYVSIMQGVTLVQLCVVQLQWPRSSII